ncbi:MAG: ribosome small subunit-dependent GTPase A, partial [Bryobacteraceae bacterium]
MTLEQLGWNVYWDGAFAPFRAEGLEPARVMIAHRGRFTVHTGNTEREVDPAGKLRSMGGLWPVTGDWVALGAGGRRIEAVVPRRTCFARTEPGEGGREQVLAANVDVAFLVGGLDGDFNPRRLERCLHLALQGGARPVIVLNKSDLCDDLVARIAQCDRLARDCPVVALSALQGHGVQQISVHVEPGQTAVLLGSSGVGKSTIVNRLLGYDRLATQAVRTGDCRGRHTTTHRELIPLDLGWLLMDVPGLRELQLLPGGESALDNAFADITGADCRFRDCSHSGEPGCAVAEALARGEIDEGRWTNYLKLRRELEFLTRSENPGAAAEYKRQTKVVHRRMRDYYRD